MLILTYIFVPETARLTLEQIDDYYFSGKPAWRTSTSKNKMIAKAGVEDDTIVDEHAAEEVKD